MSFLQPIEFRAEKIPANYPRFFNHIGDHIKATRLMRCLSAKETARTIGVDTVTLRHWEAGRITEPSLKQWPKIIRFLGYCPLVPCPTLPQQIAMWRKLQGVSSRELAKWLQVDQRTFLKFEAGGNIRRDVLGKVESQVVKLMT